MSIPPKPRPLKPKPEAIPEVLRGSPSWVTWRYELNRKRDKWTKPPYCANGWPLKKVDVTNPETWTTFDGALASYKCTGTRDGIGLVLTEDLAGVDLDHVIDADGAIEPWAVEVLEKFAGCYIERSPGGDGLRIFCRGSVARSGKGGPENRLEVYGKGSPRYLTVTGHRMGDGEVIQAQAALDWLHAEVMSKTKLLWSAEQDKPPAPTRAMSDEDVIRMATAASNGAKFNRLFSGDPGGDHSAADMALMSILRFWTQDRAQLDRLFRRSGLMRPKWDEMRGATTYGELTINKVMSGSGETYKGPISQLAALAGVASTKPDAWPALEPLEPLQELMPAPYPFDGLGPVLGPAARAVADVVQAPDALAAGSVLAAAALAAQPHVDVEMPHGDLCPVSLFVLTSAGSGDRKSAADRIVCEPIERQRRADAARHAEALAAWRRDKGEDGPPAARALIVSKGTTEGMHQLLRGQTHLGLFSPEGAEVLGGHSMREERRSAGIAWLLKAWGGETLDALTKGDGLSVLFGRRFSMHTLMQPVILRTLMADPLAQGQGWIARCLIAQPQTLAGTRMFKDGPPAREHPAVQRFHAALSQLLDLKPRIDTEGDGLALLPRVLRMDPEARELWKAFYDECERQQADGGLLAGVRPWASKAAEHAARVAGVITALHDPDAYVIPGAAMDGALQVANFYLQEHVRLCGQSRDQQHLHRLHSLLAWMKERAAAVKHADVLQFSPRPLRDLKADGLGALLGELEQRRYIRRAGDRWEVRPDA
jgi:hypothetical protein